VFYIHFSVRLKKKGPFLVKRFVSIYPELFDWVELIIDEKRFSSISHAVNEALLKLKNDMESEN
jgi:Arc/MetJ-type ribon-helix-helix transcriptional regulator